jgi:hypothetical protein
MCSKSEPKRLDIQRQTKTFRDVDRLWRVGVAFDGATHRRETPVLVNLILTVCLSGHADQCRDETLTFESRGDLHQCLFLAPMEIAKWTEEHPLYNVVKWKCSYPRDGETL